MSDCRQRLPEQGLSTDEVLELLGELKRDDVDWHSGRCWGFVYHADDAHHDFIKEVYGRFFSENGASPDVFPSLRVLENDVVRMVLDLLGGAAEGAGTMTSGGTESILLAVKAYRDLARATRKNVTDPEILVPESAHPAFLKAAHYFCLKPVFVPLDRDYRADIDALADRISSQTIVMVGSAPSLGQGIVDPIPEMGQLAAEHGIGLHVDACLGSFFLPFLKRMGRDVPEFDFNVPGVTSISADLHKNGYAAKGASAVLYYSRDLRRYQFFASGDWPGGLYASPTMQGTRAGGAIAAAWAALMSLGQDGYLDLARRAIETTDRLKAAIESLAGLSIVGNPPMNVFAFSAEAYDIFTLGERMDALGWHLSRQNAPPSLHMIVTPAHEKVVDVFLEDLEREHEALKHEPARGLPGTRSAVVYGGTAETGGDIDRANHALDRLDELYKD